MRSRNGARGSRIGGSAKSAPSAAGVNLSIMIPFGTSTNASRMGRAVSAASAGTIAWSPHLKRRALHDAENHGRPSIVGGGGFAHDLADDRAVVLLHPAPERI